MSAQKKENVSGNVLIFILIAIVLLGGLTMLLSKGSQTSEETGERERTNIKVSEMLRYTAGIEATIRKLQLNGCSENQITFKTSSWGFPSSYDPLPQYDKPQCYVFGKDGGGYPFKQIPSGIQTSAAPTDYAITSFFDVNQVGSVAPDLIIFAPGLTEQACSQINAMLKIQSYAKDSINTTPVYNGSFPLFAGPTTIGYNGTNHAYLVAQKAGCLQSTSFYTIVGSSITAFSPAPPDNVIYIYYQVLVPR